MIRIPAHPRKRQEQNAFNPVLVVKYFAEFGLPEPVFEFRNIPGRKFLLDISWTFKKLGIEIQGGIWVNQGHARRTNIRRDMTKHNLNILNGWRVLEVEPRELCSIETVNMVKRLWQQG
jgi:hypothetical protein